MFILLFATASLAFDVELLLQVGEAITVVNDTESIASDRYFKSLNEDGSRKVTEMSSVGLDVAARVGRIVSILPSPDKELLFWTDISRVECVDLSYLEKAYELRVLNFTSPRKALTQASLAAATTVALGLRSIACSYDSDRLIQFLKSQLFEIYRIFNTEPSTDMSRCFKSRLVLILDRMNAGLDPYTHPVPSLDVCMKLCPKHLKRFKFAQRESSIVSIYGDSLVTWQIPSELRHIQTWFNIIRGPSEVQLLFQQSGFSLSYIRRDGRGRLQLKSTCKAVVTSDDIITSNWVHAAVAFRAGTVSLFLNGQESVRPWAKCAVPESAQVKLGEYQGDTEVRFHDFKLSADPNTAIEILPTMFQLQELGSAVPAQCRTERNFEVAIGFTHCVPAVPFVFRTAVLALADEAESKAEERDGLPVPIFGGDLVKLDREQPSTADAEESISTGAGTAAEPYFQDWIIATIIMSGAFAVIMLLFTCCIVFQLRRYHEAALAKIQAAYGDGRV
jgi:hypothetical protein